MVSFDYTIKDVHGIHARPATDLFKMTKQYGSVVKVKKGEKEVPFKGVMGIMALGAKQGDTVTFSFDGPDEAEESDLYGEPLRCFTWRGDFIWSYTKGKQYLKGLQSESFRCIKRTKKPLSGKR